MKTFFICLFFPVFVFAQDLTGVWTGFITSGESKLPYEVAISRSNDGLTGFAMIVFTFNGVKNVGLKTLKLKEKKGKIIIEDDKLLYDNYTASAKRVILSATLEIGTGKNSSLSGSFATRSVDMRDRGKPGYSGTISLIKKIDEGPSEILGVLHELNLLESLSFLAVPKKEEPVTAATDPAKQKIQPREIKKDPVILPPATVKNLPEIKVIPRQNEIIREINFHSDSLLFTLYDNGEVDGDTVSVLLNGKVLMNKIGLTAQPVRQTIYLTPDLGDSILVVLYAENLGIYPPNTGLLIIQEGGQRYQVNFTGDFQKNSAIILRRR